MRRWTLAAALTLAAVGIAPAWAGGHRSHADDCHWTSPGGVSHGDVCAEPSCAAPCSVAPCHAVPCHVSPADCMPNAVPCGPVAPECAAPAAVADCNPACTPACRSHGCYKPRKKSFLARLWELEKRKNACIGDTFFDWVD